MAEQILWKMNDMGQKDQPCPLMTEAEIAQVRAFHQSFPQYAETPLVCLPHLAQKLGVRGIFVKDESKRFGLNAFKVLGGSYAMAKYIAGVLGREMSELPYEVLTGNAVRDALGEVTFFTATDGNHGRGVAWAANQLGQKSVVYMPFGSAPYRLEKIQAEGATATIEDMNYDDAVRLAYRASQNVPNGVVIQDTAWDGYEEIPGWIMQGYGTMALEADEQMQAAGMAPTHMLLQAGVGSLAGAVQGYFAERYGNGCPKAVIVEPHVADCHYQSAVAGGYRTVDGEMQTIMAGLACGEPNTISWEILKHWSDCFVSCPDWVAARGMRMSAAPLPGDAPILSGESGAVGLGLLSAIMEQDDLSGLREALGLDADSVVLLFSTEGNTDPQKYQDIVWDGDTPSKQ
ncbi:MAG: diaminopropionate ammonia-lyase [Oscillospiraceae bacterium]|nr:diaminopropionate ammonia-lyase [Oscillospiraceae bacterium]